MLIRSLACASGIILLEVIGAATACTGIGLFVLGIGNLFLTPGIKKKIIKTKQEIA
jgi:hypothetical protein